MSLTQLAAKPVTNITQFVEENSRKSVKYQMEKNATHRLLLPLLRYENGNPVDVVLRSEIMPDREYRPMSVSYQMHTWGQGNTYGAAICTKDIVSPELGFDGSCKICERIADAWEVKRLLDEVTEANCTMAIGAERDEYIEEQKKKHLKELKVQKPALRVYQLVVQLATGKDSLDVDGDPKFDIRISNWKPFTLEKIAKALAGGAEDDDNQEDITGKEYKIQYEDTDSTMLLASSLAVTAVDDSKSLLTKHPGLRSKILNAIAGFKFELAVSSSFSELKEMSLAQQEAEMNKVFRDYDSFSAELAVNPNAKYLSAGISVPQLPEASANILPGMVADTPQELDSILAGLDI